MILSACTKVGPRYAEFTDAQCHTVVLSTRPYCRHNRSIGASRCNGVLKRGGSGSEISRFSVSMSDDQNPPRRWSVCGEEISPSTPSGISQSPTKGRSVDRLRRHSRYPSPVQTQGAMRAMWRTQGQLCALLVVSSLLCMRPRAETPLSRGTSFPMPHWSQAPHWSLVTHLTCEPLEEVELVI